LKQPFLQEIKKRMVDILNKNSTQRTAIATAILKVSNVETIRLIEAKQIAKGDVFEFARAAGLLAIKKTSDVIPDCHPMPIEFASIKYELEAMAIKIIVEVATIYKTGVEVEAMHGAAITALTMYDMLKPIDKGIEIFNIRLEDKKGGKSSFKEAMKTNIKTAIIVCSDSVASGKKKDLAGKNISELLLQSGIETHLYKIIADEKELIQEVLLDCVRDKYDLVLYTGGTGLSPRDVTPESVEELLDRTIPGIMEAARNYGQQRTPYAMLSRGIAGMIKNTLVITLPGSTKGATETMNALFPYIKHIFKVAEGARHDE
jgi:cyclic pyranopterin phosphate synthase